MKWLSKLSIRLVQPQCNAKTIGQFFYYAHHKFARNFFYSFNFMLNKKTYR